MSLLLSFSFRIFIGVFSNNNGTSVFLPSVHFFLLQFFVFYPSSLKTVMESFSNGEEKEKEEERSLLSFKNRFDSFLLRFEKKFFEEKIDRPRRPRRRESLVLREHSFIKFSSSLLRRISYLLITFPANDPYDIYITSEIKASTV